MAYLDQSAFSNFLDALHSAEGEKGFVTAVNALARHLGFQWFAYFSQGTEVKVLTSYPKEWRERYFEKEYQTVDPVINLAKIRQEKFLWTSNELPRNPLQRRFFHEAKEVGIHTGITVPLKGGFGRTAALTFSGGPVDQEHLFAEESANYLQLAALYLHTFYDVRIGRKTELDTTGEYDLTGRQRQCLQWLAEGKQLGEIAAIMGISLATVNHHMAEIKARLGANTLFQAVALGLKYRQIFAL